jgi:GcrA cell cycle regulator
MTPLCPQGEDLGRTPQSNPAYALQFWSGSRGSLAGGRASVVKTARLSKSLCLSKHGLAVISHGTLGELGQMLRSNAWPQLHKQHAIKLAEEGLSATQIASDLFETFRIVKTRNAVIGLLFRAGRSLYGQEAQLSKERRAQAARRANIRRRSLNPPKPKAPGRVLRGQAKALKAVFAQAQPLPPTQETDIGRVHILDLEPKHCRWVCSEPTDGMFCGAEKVPGLPYCSHHSQRAFQPPNVGPSQHFQLTDRVIGLKGFGAKTPTSEETTNTIKNLETV